MYQSDALPLLANIIPHFQILGYLTSSEMLLLQFETFYYILKSVTGSIANLILKFKEGTFNLTF